MRKTLCLVALFGSSIAQALPVINEVDADNPSTDTAEFIELFDGGNGNTPLDGYSLVLFNGSNDSSYQAFDLDGQMTNAQGYFVLCGDAESVANCDLEVSPNSNLIQNGADAVALYQADAADFPSSSSITQVGLVDALVYDTNDNDDAALLELLNPNQPQVNEGGAGDKDNHSNQRCGELTTQNTDGYIQTTPTPGLANACDTDTVEEPSLGECGDTSVSGFAYIHQVQGDILDIENDASPLYGNTVIVEGIITADFQGGTLANGDNSYQYSGYWIQEEDSDADASSNTSEGVFVYDYQSTVSIGDKVRLMATATEYNNATQLKSVSELSVCAENQALPTAISVTLPVADLTELEAVEGMLIENNQNLIVSDLYGTGYGFANYGQFVVSSKLHFQPTEIAVPLSDAAIAAAEARPLDVLLIDDGVAASYPSYIPFPDESGYNASNPMRIGYSVPALAGVMHGWKNNYTVIPSNIVIDPTAPRTAEPVIAQDANLVIVGMNVLNYFNGDGLGEGFPTSRGAPSYEALVMQTDKIVSALTVMNADVIALMEIENDGFDENSAIQSLVTALNIMQSEGNEYTFINPGVSTIGTDEISVGLLYRNQKLQAIGSTAILDSSNSPLNENGDVLFVDTKNRPSLIQSFSFEGDTFTLSVNHLKSKGSACDEADEGLDGQGNCNQSRTNAAQALTEFLATNPTGIATDKVMILGDLNAYSQEDPMQLFYQNGFENLKYTDKATEEKPFSYSYSGFLGSLDHALSSSALTDNVLSVDAWHINSVEDSTMDYLTEDNGQTYSSIDNYAAPDAYRSSDHDPIIVALNMGNSAPEFIQEIPHISIARKRERINTDFSEYVMDSDNDELLYSSNSLPNGLTLSASGQLTGKLKTYISNSQPVQFDLVISDGKETIQSEATIVLERADSPIRKFLNRLIGWFSAWFGR